MNVRFLKRVPVVDVKHCTGCARCVEACGPKALEIIRSIAVLASPDTCGSDELCIKPCPEGALEMQWTEAAGDKARGQWRAEVDFQEIVKSIRPARALTSPITRVRVGKLPSTHHALSD